MSTKKVVKKAVKGSATTAVKKVKQETKKPDMPPVSKDNLPGIMPEVTDKSALKRQRFMAARKEVLVLRVPSALLAFLAETGWARGGQSGAATIAQEVLDAWYAKEVERANNKKVAIKK